MKVFVYIFFLLIVLSSVFALDFSSITFVAPNGNVSVVAGVVSADAVTVDSFVGFINQSSSYNFTGQGTTAFLGVRDAFDVLFDVTNDSILLFNVRDYYLLFLDNHTYAWVSDSRIHSVSSGVSAPISVVTNLTVFSDEDFRIVFDRTSYIVSSADPVLSLKVSLFKGDSPVFCSTSGRFVDSSNAGVMFSVLPYSVRGNVYFFSVNLGAFPPGNYEFIVDSCKGSRGVPVVVGRISDSQSWFIYVLIFVVIMSLSIWVYFARKNRDGDVQI